MILLFTGGSASGKSALAEQACVHAGGHLLYIATMQPFGEEGRARVRKHRAQRAGKGFHTVECYSWLREPLQAGAFDDATVLLECLGNLVANVTFGDGGQAGDRRWCDEAAARLESELDELASRSAHLVVVGNEVGSDGVRYETDTQAYQDLIGRVSRTLAARADLVVESAAGAPIIVKRAHGRQHDGALSDLIDSIRGEVR